MSRPLSAPRCYGLGSMFGADASICGTCPCHDSCLVLAKISLEKTSVVIGENNVAAMHVSAKAEEVREIVEVLSSPETQPMSVPASNKKLASLIKQMAQNNPCVADYLHAGKNPFSVSAKPVYIRGLVGIMLDGGSENDQLAFLSDILGKSEVESEKTITLVKEAFGVMGFSFKEKT